MYKLCRINIDAREKIYLELENFIQKLKKKYPITSIYLFGSFATGDIHEGSDIDLIIIGQFKERFIERIGMILELTDLPIEPLVYTENEFQNMIENKNPFILEILKHAKKF
ncbi:MAG: nucleotidyltransferase domain-containing protein [Candidatus Lokiarchaeota archaeon]|nr:nucleotidyltransferase domain-containing protein [Candidatus Lokiarchaeota archaeon]